MGFWQKLFKKEPEEEKVDFYKLSEWLTSKSEFDFGIDLTEIGRTRETIDKNLKALAKVDVAKLKVEEKLKILVEGNRPAYIRSVSSFLDKIEMPEELDSETLSEFCKKIQSELNKLNKRTQRNFFILQNLIGEELMAVVKALKKLDILAERIKDKMKIGQLDVVEDVQNRLKDIYTYIGEGEQRKKKLRDLDKEKADLMETVQNLNLEIKRMKTGSRLQELNELRSKKDDLLEKINGVRNGFENRFSPLQKALKKMSKIEPSKIVENYAHKPFYTLMDDHKLEILTILRHLRKYVEKDKLELKEGKKEKILPAIDYLDKEYLREVRLAVRKAEEDILQAEEKLKGNTFERDVNKLISRFNEKNTQLTEIDNKVSKMKERNITKDIKIIEKDLNKLTGVKIVIENAPVD
jgi:hypothetical protein